ncbi:MAG: hypothetical protein M0R80_04845 [Proteobacteria bacterium]|nr:hypothetical protein [Pseudomonadota bacterium]
MQSPNSSAASSQSSMAQSSPLCLTKQFSRLWNSPSQSSSSAQSNVSSQISSARPSSKLYGSPSSYYAHVST